MTVEELIEALRKMPSDAIVRIKNELSGEDQYAERIDLDNHGQVWIHETN